jgi:hypothetical protein
MCNHMFDGEGVPEVVHVVDRIVVRYCHVKLLVSELAGLVLRLALKWRIGSSTRSCYTLQSARYSVWLLNLPTTAL